MSGQDMVRSGGELASVVAGQVGNPPLRRPQLFIPGQAGIQFDTPDADCPVYETVPGFQPPLE